MPQHPSFPKTGKRSSYPIGSCIFINLHIWPQLVYFFQPHGAMYAYFPLSIQYSIPALSNLHIPASGCTKFTSYGKQLPPMAQSLLWHLYAAYATNSSFTAHIRLPRHIFDFYGTSSPYIENICLSWIPSPSKVQDKSNINHPDNGKTQLDNVVYS